MLPKFPLARRFVLPIIVLAIVCWGSPISAQVSVWDSSVPEDILQGIYPIGGTAEVNEEFVVSDLEQSATAALQLGIRARGVSGSPVSWDGDRLYVVQPGTSGGVANWFYDLHLDFGSAYLAAATGLALVPQSMADYQVLLQVDIDPTAGIDFVDTFVPAVVDPIQLVQSRQNVLVGNFYGGPYPGLVSAGHYVIRLSVLSQAGAELVAAEMEVQVAGPLDIPTLGVSGLLTMALLVAIGGLWLLGRTGLGPAGSL